MCIVVFVICLKRKYHLFIYNPFEILQPALMRFDRIVNMYAGNLAEETKNLTSNMDSFVADIYSASEKSVESVNLFYIFNRAYNSV